MCHSGRGRKGGPFVLRFDTYLNRFPHILSSRLIFSSVVLLVLCGGGVSVFVFFAFPLQLNLRKLLRSAVFIYGSRGYRGNIFPRPRYHACLWFLSRREGSTFLLHVDFFLYFYEFNLPHVRCAINSAFVVLLAMSCVRQVSLHAGVGRFGC